MIPPSRPKFSLSFVKISLLSSLILSHSVYANNIAKDSAKSDDKDQIDISGYVMFDYDNVDGGFFEHDDESASLSEIRRARLSLKSEFARDWKTKLQLDFSGDSADIKDAYLQYTGWKWANITIGKQKEAFGLEKLTSSRNALMIERSIVTEALAPGRSLGIAANGGNKQLTWQLGYYQLDETEDASAITGRLSWLPWQQGKNLVHLGLAFSERDLNGSEFRLNETLEVHSADSLFEGEQLIAEQQSLQGVEFLWQQAGFTTMAEWQQSTVTDVNDSEYDYQGGYVQFSYQLSGDNRRYKNGKLGAVTTPGWEITSRFSQLELVTEQREAQIYSLGVNYTVNKNLKFMADYIKAKQFEFELEQDFSDAISLRVQYSF